MRIENLDEFVFRAKELSAQNPGDARYSIKYRHKSGQVVAKMTDDKQCLTYTTDQGKELYNLQALSEWFYSACTGVKRTRAESTQAETEAGTSAPETKVAKTATSASGEGNAAADSGKSKKGKKKKGRR